MGAGQSGAGALPQEVVLQADAYADIPPPIDPSALAALIGGTTAGVGILRPAPPGVFRMRRAALTAVPGLLERFARFGVAGDYIDHQPGSAVPRCLATNQLVVENLTDDEQLGRVAPCPERVAVYRALGMHSAVILPVSVRSGPIGVLGLVRAGGSPPFTAEDVVVARELAARAAVDLDHARRFTHEHTIALELQRSLLSEPRPPHPHIEVATRYLPADRQALVGGDWFDVIPLRDGRRPRGVGCCSGGTVSGGCEDRCHEALPSRRHRGRGPQQLGRRHHDARVPAALDARQPRPGPVRGHRPGPARPAGR